MEFLLTHPVWDVTSKQLVFLDNSGISTHTSRVGCDFMTGGIDVNRLTGFLLTHPVWDVTINTVYINKSKNQISTHTSRVGCDLLFRPQLVQL